MCQGNYVRSQKQKERQKNERHTAEEKAGEIGQKWRSQRSEALEGLNPPLFTLKTKRPGIKACRRPQEVEYEPQPQSTKKQGPQFHHAQKGILPTSQSRSYVP